MTAATVALPGLVSVLTTFTREVGSAPFAVRAAAAGVRQLVRAFVPDPAASKLARLRRSVGVAARAIEAASVERTRMAMVTLTYRGTNDDWRPEHIRRFVNAVREWLSRRGVACRYVWVAELQKRGVIHYHALFWLPHGVELPKPDQCGWWPHGSSRVEWARKAVPYLMKYCSKGNELSGGSLPHRARSHGRGGLGQYWRSLVSWLSLPAFIQARAAVGERWQRVRGGGWVSPDGELYSSEFQRSWVGDRYGLLRVADHGRPFDVSGPFSWLPEVAC